ncbi:hypothetical protein DFJ77DRAFT_531536 [Powellomyces hirtus]|nr:hypothetical protein DFJ77DRAFT_531536 [Powellomyces hirtus]
MSTEEGTITIVDFLNQQENLLQEASEVLPGVIDKCSYDKGYIRQNVYACRTCQTGAEGESRAGVCYGCLWQAHYNFQFLMLQLTHLNGSTVPYKLSRCSRIVLQETFQKLPGKCTLQRKDEEEENGENKYNGNYDGAFCFCKTLYDPEKEEGVMFQCFLCEGSVRIIFRLYPRLTNMHDRCIGKVPDDGVDAEYICRDCVAKHLFLTCYRNYPVFDFVHHPTPEKAIPISDPADGTSRVEKKRPRVECEASSPSKKVRQEPDAPRAEIDIEALCQIESTSPLSQSSSDPFPDVFCREGWRLQLCRCDKCMQMYETEGIPFIVKEEEIFEPEEDENADASLHDIGLKQLNVMKRDEAINGVLAYQSMKKDLTAFLQQFADDGRVVTAADIKDYFANKEAERKRGRHN